MTVVEWIEMWRNMLRTNIKTSNCNYWNIHWRWQHYYIYCWGYCQWCKESIYIKYILTLFEKINALRRPERLESFLKSNENDINLRDVGSHTLDTYIDITSLLDNEAEVDYQYDINTILTPPCRFNHKTISFWYNQNIMLVIYHNTFLNSKKSACLACL